MLERLRQYKEYASRKDAPKHLCTKRELELLNLRIAVGQEPAAYYLAKVNYLPLYDPNEAAKVTRGKSSKANRTAVDPLNVQTQPKQPNPAPYTALDHLELCRSMVPGFSWKTEDVTHQSISCRGCGQRHANRLEMQSCDAYNYYILSDYMRDEAKDVLMDNEENLLFVDVETTGLSDRDEIIEIAILSTDGTVLFESLVRPSVPVSPNARMIHRIPDEALAFAPSWPEIYVQVAQMLHGKQLVAHNAALEVRMLKQTSLRYRLPPPLLGRAHCTMKMLARASGNDAWWKLSDAMKRARVSPPTMTVHAHRAVFDAECCRRLIVEFAKSENQSEMII